jgi:histidinol-phosphate aminotransferase
MRYSLRPNVLRMRPYSPGKPIDEVKRELGLTEVVKLASNENPFGPSPRAIEAAQRAALTMNLYPDAAAHDLRAALADHLGLPPVQIAIGNGSDELIHLLGLVFLAGPEDAMIVGDPSFVRYDAAAQMADAQLVKVPLDAELRHDVAAMADAVTPATRLVWIANPNNPTGTIVRHDTVDRLIDRLPEGAALVLDEAYYEYLDPAELATYPGALDYVQAGAPVIGLRTFSKAYGMAGLRLGYCFAAPEVIDAIERAREPFNANSLAQAAAIAALADQDHLRATVTKNREGLDRLREVFLAAGARPVESHANFILADLGRPARPVFEALLARGVIVRPGDVLGLPTCLRVSVGTPDEVQRFAEAFGEVFQPAPA